MLGKLAVQRPHTEWIKRSWLLAPPAMKLIMVHIQYCTLAHRRQGQGHGSHAVSHSTSFSPFADDITVLATNRVNLKRDICRDISNNLPEPHSASIFAGKSREHILWSDMVLHRWHSRVYCKWKDDFSALPAEKEKRHNNCSHTKNNIYCTIKQFKLK